jgi:hypothetical protein
MSSGRHKLAVPFRSPDGIHCSTGCKWIVGLPWAEPKCLLLGVLKRDYSTKTGRRVVRHRECLKYDSRRGRPRIVCLCGSTRFYVGFQRAYFEESLRGRIVLSVGFAPGIADGQHNEQAGGISPFQKQNLDRLHMAKIDLADEILVVNQEGYVGKSTAREIAHARKRGKLVRWLYPDLVMAPYRTEKP